jgi:hypothetical protein
MSHYSLHHRGRQRKEGSKRRLSSLPNPSLLSDRATKENFIASESLSTEALSPPVPIAPSYLHLNLCKFKLKLIK